MIGKKFEKKNLTIALNVLYAKKRNIYPTFVSKHYSKREKQIILLMIPKGEGLFYIAVKKLSALLRKISSWWSFFFRLNRLHSFRTKNKLESNKSYVKIISFVIL